MSDKSRIAAILGRNREDQDATCSSQKYLVDIIAALQIRDTPEKVAGVNNRTAVEGGQMAPTQAHVFSIPIVLISIENQCR
jgi:hypothetical protein